MQRATQHGLNMWPDDEKQREHERVSLPGSPQRIIHFTYLGRFLFIMLLIAGMFYVTCLVSYNLQTVREVRVFTDKNSL